MPQRARTFKVNCCLKVHNAHRKLLQGADSIAPIDTPPYFSAHAH